MDKSWEQMTAAEKQEAQFQKLLSPKDPEGNDVQFQSKEAEALYKANITRIKDAIQMKKKPDRVPVTIYPSMFPYYYSGVKLKDAMYDYELCTSAFKKYIMEFQPDMHIGASVLGPGRFFELMDYKLYAWPGHGVGDNHCYQCLEKEYMTEDEYDILLTDPSFFFQNFYLPRVFGSLNGFTMLPSFTGVLEMYGVAFNFIPYALPPVQETFKTLFEAGAEAMKWAMAMGGCDAELRSFGYPNILAGYSKAPFDVIGDTLRGTHGVMLDMYRRPETLLKALDQQIPIMTAMGINTMKMTGNPLIFMPLHKGADGFLSDEQFKKFYWPQLKQIMEGLIEGGCVPWLALEGRWNTRLEVMQDIPEGKTLLMIDQSDIQKAKATVGKKACLTGNVPSSLLHLGTPEDVKKYCKMLIDTVGKDGGLILANGAFLDEAKPENVKAMVEFSKEYGVYK